MLIEFASKRNEPELAPYIAERQNGFTDRSNRDGELGVMVVF